MVRWALDDILPPNPSDEPRGRRLEASFVSLQLLLACAQTSPISFASLPWLHRPVLKISGVARTLVSNTKNSGTLGIASRVKLRKYETSACRLFYSILIHVLLNI